MTPPGFQTLLEGGVELIECLGKVVQDLFAEAVADQDVPVGLGVTGDAAGDRTESELGVAPRAQDVGNGLVGQLVGGDAGDPDDMVQVGPPQRLAKLLLPLNHRRRDARALFLPRGDFLPAGDAPLQPADGGVVARARVGARETERQGVLAHLDLPTRLRVHTTNSFLWCAPARWLGVARRVAAG